MDIFAKWQRQDTPEKNRIPALIVGALIFPISAPALIVFFAPHIDVYLVWRRARRFPGCRPSNCSSPDRSPTAGIR
jgi:hypothetical protein